MLESSIPTIESGKKDETNQKDMKRVSDVSVCGLSAS